MTNTYVMVRPSILVGFPHKIFSLWMCIRQNNAFWETFLLSSPVVSFIANLLRTTHTMCMPDMQARHLLRIARTIPAEYGNHGSSSKFMHFFYYHYWQWHSGHDIPFKNSFQRFKYSDKIVNLLPFDIFRGSVIFSTDCLDFFNLNRIFPHYKAIFKKLRWLGIFHCFENNKTGVTKTPLSHKQMVKMEFWQTTSF